MSDRICQIQEQVLIVRCQAGDTEAFTELVQLHHDRLCYFVKKMLGVEASPEDVLQEIWLDVFRGLARLAEPKAFRAWLYGIARARTYRTWRKRRPLPLPLDEVENEPALVDDFSEEDAGHIHRALDDLPPDLREVLVLRFLEDMPYEEIARTIGCPVGTVRSRIHYGKLALRRIIERKTAHERERTR